MTREQQIAFIFSKCLDVGIDFWKNSPRVNGTKFRRTRPIRLADVLLAIEPIRTRRGLLNAAAEGVVKAWDLRKDDLTEQSDETIRFIHGLLK
jgi:hypothetical protein